MFHYFEAEGCPTQFDCATPAEEFVLPRASSVAVSSEKMVSRMTK